MWTSRSAESVYVLCGVVLCAWCYKAQTSAILRSPRIKPEIMCRYAAAYPDEDGYRRVETLNEDVLGSDLWTAARVSHFWRIHLLSTTKQAHCKLHRCITISG